MKLWLWILAPLAVFVALYVVVGRDLLKATAFGKRFFDCIEPVEIRLWKKSETILFARLKMIVGLLLTLLTQLGTIDLTSLMPLVPDEYEPALKAAFNLLPLVLTLLGFMDEHLRNKTTRPVELVAIPEAVPLPPEVAAAVMRAEVVKRNAVAVVESAKAEGTV